MTKPRSPRNPAGHSHIHVRPLEIGDFQFVQGLASKQPNFTVPSAYLLWLLLRIDGAICIASEHSRKGPLAYLLALPVKEPKRSMFVWQFAASDGPEREAASLALLTKSREVAVGLGVESVIFSSVPNSAAYRVIRRYAWKVFSAVPKAISNLPSLVNPIEREFILPLKTQGVKIE
jgi:hypothetical protein